MTVHIFLKEANINELFLQYFGKFDLTLIVFILPICNIILATVITKKFVFFSLTCFFLDINYNIHVIQSCLMAQQKCTRHDGCIMQPCSDTSIANVYCDIT